MDEQMTDEQFNELLGLAVLHGRPAAMLFQDVDGNWRGAYAKKDMPSVFVRDIGPETVLQLLLTHDGQTH